MFDREISQLSRQPNRNVCELKGLAIKNVFSLSLLLPVVAMIIFFAMFFLVEKSDDRHLLFEKGDHVRAVVYASKAIESESNACARIYYEFKAKNGFKYSGDSRVDVNSNACHLKNGDSITVVYLPDHPTINEVESKVSGFSGLGRMFFLFPLFFLIIFAPMLMPDLRKLLFHRRLYRTGIWSEGKIVYIKNGNQSFLDGYVNASAKLYFEFNLPDGRLVESVTEVRNEWLVNNLEYDQKINIIYNASRPRKAMVIECYIR